MKKLGMITTSIFLLSISAIAQAVPMIYTFEGVATGFQSYHQDYNITDFDLTIGETPLEYVFEVDFDASNHSFTNSEGTWNYFYSDLINGSIINGGNVYGDYYGFNWDRQNGPNIGQISSNLANVRITAFENETLDWMVHDWAIGQAFTSTDLACYPSNSACAVYAFGEVVLTKIESASIDEPKPLMIIGLGLLLLFSTLRKSSHSLNLDWKN